MKLLLLISVGLTLVSAAVVRKGLIVPLENQVCYTNYGCFSDEWPWTSIHRPLAGLPWAPWGVGTRFLLFTRANQYEDFELVPDNDLILADSPFDSNKRTVFLVHGFTESHLEDWVVKARNGLLAKEDVNVICVDWSPGAARSYLTATNNVRMVGAQMIRLMNFLMNKAELDLSTVRIVAHSIGSHAASYAGEHYWGAIGHITALDPTDLYFGSSDILVRIDKSDATHVQVIHTNGDSLGGMGIKAAIGHVDIYVNGGNTQPGCDDLLSGIIGSIINLIGFEFDEPFAPLVCSHTRANEYYVESIESQCPFVARKCDSYSDYEDGVCHTDCSTPGRCTVLGYTTEDYSSARGTFHLDTDDTKAFCLQSVQFDTTVAVGQDRTEGKVKMTTIYRDGEVDFTFTDGGLSAGQILNKWTDVPSKILAVPTGKPIRIDVRYTRNGLFDERYLELDPTTVSVVNEQLKLQSVHFRGVTLETGVESSIYPL